MPEYLQPAILTSLNTIKHGCRSQQQLLKHEDPNEFLKLRATYLEEFNPQSPFLEELLDEAVRAHWFLKRNQTNLHIVQMDLAEDPRIWHPQEHHQIALFTRYQTAAERTFTRALTRLRCYHRDQVRKEQTPKDQQTQEQQPKQPAKSSKSEKPKANDEPIILEQWVEIRRVDNKVVTQFFPSNNELEQTISKADPKPTMVYRRLFFPDGVPQQYEWTRPRNGQAKNGGLAIQRMTIETWLSLRDKERETGKAESTGEKVNLRD